MTISKSRVFSTHGAIIGGKAFVDGYACHSSGVAVTLRFAQEVSCRFESPENHERVMKKQLSRGDVPGGVLYCFKRLRTALE